MGFLLRSIRFVLPAAIVAACFAPAILASPSTTDKTIVISEAGGWGTIRGIVRDEGGSPIADATVAVFRVGTSTLLKQVSTAANGSFIAKVMPGTYSILAVAQGFNPITLPAVEVARSGDLSYGFKLERAGSGNTLPEKKLDRNSSKWRIRAAQSQRSIYQNTPGNAPVDEDQATDDDADVADAADKQKTARPQAVVETYFATNNDGNYQGVNFATLIPVNPKIDLTIAGQATRGRRSPQRLETALSFRANAKHDLKFTTSFASLGTIVDGDDERGLGQLSFQAVDEWKLRDGVILVLGFDYSKFVGAGSDSAITPRVGLQFDVDPKTRFRAAFTPQTDERTWGDAVDLEGTSVSFREPVAVEDLFVVNKKPRMNRSTRLEFGVERILDNRSSVEANVFVDTVFARGVGINRFSFDSLDDNTFDGIVGNQQGRASGIRLVYSRRLTGIFNASAGYSFGTGQKLSAEALTDPSSLFKNAAFQTFFGEVDADFDTGTSVKTIFRLSPQATVFAIDPFKGRLAIYDPGLSVLVTQRLPRFGLPLRAQAIVDARNVFDFQNGVNSVDGVLRLDARQRAFRGGIMVQF